MTSPSFINEKNLYEQDFYLWTQTIALKKAIESFQSVYESEPNIYKSPISIEELH
ncbi:hypothetical protein [Nostoc sp.]|uniref:hypothetical protein n=1 Tax=Nostoc sp. TaxID=1180 RepID=UPI002FF464B1